MAKAAAGSERPRRTREHINASKSHNYIEKFFVDKGHTVDRPGADYGYDVLVNTYDAEGYAESGLPTRTMGRELAEDTLFFAAPLAAGRALAKAAGG